MPEPLVSICIPAYNAERHLAETLASIRAQTFSDWELIVVEDGSHDRTGQIVQAFAESVKQPVRLHRHETNRGLPATRNTAISLARAEWIALIDADDLWTPDHLARALTHAERHPCDLIHTGVVLFESETGLDIEVRAPSDAARATLHTSLYTGRYPIQPSSALIRRDLCLRTGGFDTTLRYVEDREFWLRLARTGARICYVNFNTCRYRQHTSAMTRHAAAMAHGLATVLERHGDWDAVPVAIRRKHTAAAWLAAGRIIFRQNPRLARTYFYRALRQRPANPRHAAYWMAAALLGTTPAANVPSPRDTPKTTAA